MGFFQTEEAAKASKKVKPRIAKARPQKQVIPILTQTGLSCRDCTLDKEPLHHPKMKPTGARAPLLYILGEAPGENEDEQGAQFIGRAGELIRDYIPKAMNKYIRWNNTLRCRPPGNRAPTEHELRCCSHWQREDIEESKPMIIAGFGNSPLEWALGRSGITRWHGMLVPVRIGSYECWYAPMWHPSYVMRMKNAEEIGPPIYKMYRKELERVFALIQTVLDGDGIDVPVIPTRNECDEGLHTIETWQVSDVERALKIMKKYRNQAVDLETTHLRPYFDGANILSIAFGVWEESYAIPLMHPEAKWTVKQLREVVSLIKAYLLTSGNTFWAHNLKFELEWLFQLYGASVMYEVQWGDTMAQAHILHDQREKSLEARCVALLGVNNKELDKLDKEHMAREPLPKVLRYNARDVKFTDWVREIQTDEIARQGLEKPYQAMISRTPTLVLAQAYGLTPDTKFAEAKHRELTLDANLILNKIQKLEEAKRHVVKTGKPFNPNSPKQLQSVLHITGSTDVDALSRLKKPLAKLVLELRAVQKLDSTYVKGYCPSEGAEYIYPDGKIHTNFNHLVTSTGRLASEGPNLQNFPVRTPRGKLIRNLIAAPPGQVIVAVDYGQIEARIIAIASGDKNLIKALWEQFDIHMDWVMKVVKKFPHVLDPYRIPEYDTEKKIIKAFRGDFKSIWTFPLFFGSELDPVAARLEVPARKLRPLYDEFWNTYAGVKAWQERLMKGYDKNGYVETLTKRRRHGPLTMNEATNAPIQGTASDIVIDAMERLGKLSYEMERPQLQARMNIHDDLSFVLPQKTLERDLDIILPIMVQPRFDWVTVPITVEIKIGQKWGELNEIGVVESTEYGFPAVKSHSKPWISKPVQRQSR